VINDMYIFFQYAVVIAVVLYKSQKSRVKVFYISISMNDAP